MSSGSGATKNNTTTNEQPKTPLTVVTLPPVNIPTFYKRQPVLWFSMVESVFATSGVNPDDPNRHHYVVKALPEDVITDVRDIVLEKRGYDQLKQALIERYTQPIEERFNQLLRKELTGDMTPSQIYRRCHELADGDDACNSEMIKRIWINKLPQQLQQMLKIAADQNIEQLVKLADNIAAIPTATAQVSAIAQPQQIYNPPAEMSTQTAEILKSLVNQISALTMEVSEIRKRSEQRHNRQHYGRSRTPSRYWNGWNNRPNSRPATPARSRNNSAERHETGLCYYHYRHGNEARNCREPCSFKKN